MGPNLDPFLGHLKSFESLKSLKGQLDIKNYELLETD